MGKKNNTEHSTAERSKDDWSKSGTTKPSNAGGGGDTTQDVDPSYVLDDSEMYIDVHEHEVNANHNNNRKKTVVDLRASAQQSLMNTQEHTHKEKEKKTKKQRN